MFFTAPLFAEPIYGKKDSVQRSIKVKRFTSIDVSGPISIKVTPDERTDACTKLSLYANEDLLPYLKFENKGDTLHISTTAPVIPIDWIYISAECYGITAVNAGMFSHVGVTALDGLSFSAKSTGGSIALTGKVNLLQATIEGNGYMDLTWLDMANANFNVFTAGYIRTGMPASYTAETTEQGEIHIFSTDHKRDYKTMLKPGVFLRAKMWSTPRDGIIGLNYNVYSRIKEKLERHYNP